MMNRCFLLLLLFVNGYYTNAQINGCTDPLATNYDSLATSNDGSCLYNVTSVSPITTWSLPDIMVETSGLIFWNQKFWTHNDNSDTNIYSFDTINISNYQSFPLNSTSNIDWEEISQDSSYIYVGDFGNNANGNRTNLKILRIEKNSLLTNVPIIDTINFNYSLQTDYTAIGSNNTNFDCESFIVTQDSIYLFTKEWVSKATTIYSLPKLSGSYVAQARQSYYVDGLITGATFLEDKKLIVLCGYSQVLQPFLFMLYDFESQNFFNGNKRKILLNMSMHQVEGIATEDGITYYVTNEKVGQTVPQQIHKIDLAEYFYSPVNVTENQSEVFEIAPNPVIDFVEITITPNQIGKEYLILDFTGQVVQQGVLNEKQSRLNLKNLSPGTYVIAINKPGSINRKIIKLEN